MRNFLKSLWLLPVAMGFFAFSAHAQAFSQDISISPGDIRMPSNILKGGQARIYVTVRNNSSSDLSGVVKFYNEKTSSFLSADQPVSILAGKTDDVFIDFRADALGQNPIAVRVVPWIEEGDDPSNNKVTANLYVDVDQDGDGIGDANDPDDDNDGVNDKDDAFPRDPSESKDTDGDGVGDNVDADDDNDGVSDVEDSFPTDSSESKDSDGDGTGDNKDLFPYDSAEWVDSDGDGIGDNEDPDDDNHGPEPFITMSDTSVRLGETITFNGLKSEDPDGDIVDYKWDFGNGMTSTGVITEHKYDQSGEYIVTLSVTDNKGEIRDQQVQVSVGMNLWLLLLIIVSILLIILLLGLLVPGSRFHHKKMRMNFK